MRPLARPIATMLSPSREEMRERSLKQVITNYFNDSYKSAVSALVEEEKISVDELKEIIRMVEEKDCPEAEK